MASNMYIKCEECIHGWGTEGGRRGKRETQLGRDEFPIEHEVIYPVQGVVSKKERKRKRSSIYT